MRRLATLAVVAALMSPAAASGQDDTFGDWARDQGYSPGDVMPDRVDARSSSIDSPDGIGEFDWTTTPTRRLYLDGNQISTIESGDFSGLTNLFWLCLQGNQLSSIEPGDFSGLTNLLELLLGGNQISSIESGDFSGLTNLTGLRLQDNQISSIESGDFSGLTNLTRLDLKDNQLSSIEPGAFSGLTHSWELYLADNALLTSLNLGATDLSGLVGLHLANVNITSVSLRNSVVNDESLVSLIYGDTLGWLIGIGDLDGITEMDLSGIDFGDITDLSPLYVMDDLTDLWLVDTRNVDASGLDLLLDNLAAIEGHAEGILYMTQADYDAFNTADGGLLAAWDDEKGHHVEFLQIGDVNHDTEVNGLDVDPFVDVLLASRFDVAADMNGDGAVNGLDVEPFVAAAVSGAQQIPEPSTLLLALIGLGVIGGWRKGGV